MTRPPSSLSRTATHYDALGLAQNASIGAVRKAYKELSLEIHPDKVLQRGGTASQIRAAGSAFQRINDAHAILIDPVKKKQYDTSLGAMRPGMGATPDGPNVFPSGGSRQPPSYNSTPVPPFEGRQPRGEEFFFNPTLIQKHRRSCFTGKRQEGEEEKEAPGFYATAAGNRSGNGFFSAPNGRWYEGKFKDGQFHEHGTLFARGFLYKGGFFRGERHGFGVEACPNWFGYAQRPDTVFTENWTDCRYEGSYRHNQRHGRGKEFWPHANYTCEGNYFRGFRHGPFVGSWSTVYETPLRYHHGYMMQLEKRSLFSRREYYYRSLGRRY